jgi:transposase-like protein
MAPFQQKRLPAFRDQQEYTTGRPTDYRPEFCQLVIEQMSKGISLGAFAGVIGMARETVYRWVREHREFHDAVSRARAAQQLAWELKLLHSRKGAETMASIFALKNIAPDQWRDLKQTQHTHTVQASLLTDAQLNAIAAGASPADAGVIEADYTVVQP